jgi:arginyl-tRNA synthetase
MTQDIYAQLRDAVVAALRDTVPDLPDDLADRVELTAPRDPSHGDVATNAALLAAKPARQPPAKLAAAIADRLRAIPTIAEATVAGPGFINLRLDPAALHAVLPAVLRAGEAFGDSTIGENLAVNVEYVSTNPTGPLHVGHCRGAVVGDALANLLAKAGFAVTKEYYINDAGAQVTALAWAAYWRYLQAIGTKLSEEQFSDEVPGGLQYRGDYLIPVGEELAVEFGAALADPGGEVAAPHIWLDIVRDFTVAQMMRAIREDLALLGVAQDVYFSERSLVVSGAADATIDWLAARDLIYEGTLDPPKGKTPEDWEPRPQTLFRATQFGDDIDRPLRKSDGSNTYFANDIAYHRDKFERGFTRMIDVWGADHGGYVSRLKAAVKAVSDNAAHLEIVLCQIVHVLRSGEQVKMSKRAGAFVTLRDLIEEIGRDAVRFTMLTRKADAQMDFDLDAVVAQTRDNPVFYVQYAHARCRSVLRAAAEMFGPEAVTDAALAERALEPPTPPEADPANPPATDPGPPKTGLTCLTSEPELALIRRIAGWPRTVQAAALASEPYRIAFFLYDLAADFHMLWNRGQADATLRFLQPALPGDTLARLALVAATAVTIRSGLAVMGVAPVEEMR